MRIVKAVSLMTLVCASIAARGAEPAPADNANAAQAAVTAETQASIPFANRDGIYDWRVVDSRTVLIQSLGRQWYKATLMSPCFDLPFAQRIGFKTNPDGSFDKFGAIQVRDQYCPLTSLVKSAPPVQKSKRHPNASVTPASPAPDSAPPSAPPASSAPQ